MDKRAKAAAIVARLIVLMEGRIQSQIPDAKFDADLSDGEYKLVEDLIDEITGIVED